MRLLNCVTKSLTSLPLALLFVFGSTGDAKAQGYYYNYQYSFTPYYSSWHYNTWVAPTPVYHTSYYYNYRYGF
jgi:hypothetical protein